MANKNLFQTIRGPLARPADTVNEAGGATYRFSDRHALAQLTVTGCFNGVYYADAGTQLQQARELAERVEPAFVARTAVYARQRGHMKDMPAFLCAVLARRDIDLLAAVFERVVDNGRMLRSFVQIVRSGVAGRKSLGTAPRRLVRQWLERRSDEDVFRASVGNDPSLADVIRMVHPRPATPGREALYAYLLGRESRAEQLPELIRRLEDFRSGRSDEVPDVPFQFLAQAGLPASVWRQIARQGSWQMVRMNLNTFSRHGVFADPETTRQIAAKLRDPKAVRQARAFPYQLLTAFRMAGDDIPAEVREALQDALETAIENVPGIDGTVVVCPDVSGSMRSPVTGFRRGATTRVECIDVAALLAAAMLRRNPRTEVLPFSSDVVRVELNPRDSVMTNAARLAALPSGGTCCSAPLRLLNRRGARADLVVLVSDNQSWLESFHQPGQPVPRTTAEWRVFRQRNPSARMVCLDLQPYTSTQIQDDPDVLNIGGFSDAVFDVMALYAEGRAGVDHWVDGIERIAI